jgi:hypothetical protein
MLQYVPTCRPGEPWSLTMPLANMQRHLACLQKLPLLGPCFYRQAGWRGKNTRPAPKLGHMHPPEEHRGSGLRASKWGDYARPL